MTISLDLMDMMMRNREDWEMEFWTKVQYNCVVVYNL